MIYLKRLLWLIGAIPVYLIAGFFYALQIPLSLILMFFYFLKDGKNDIWMDSYFNPAIIGIFLTEKYEDLLYSLNKKQNKKQKIK